MNGVLYEPPKPHECNPPKPEYRHMEGPRAGSVWRCPYCLTCYLRKTGSYGNFWNKISQRKYLKLSNRIRKEQEICDQEMAQEREITETLRAHRIVAE